MPVGLALGGAALGAVGSVAAASMGADAQKDAAEKASDTSFEVAQLNNDLYRDIYDQNLGVLSPYVQGGLPAMYELNGLLGLDSVRAPAPTAPPAASTPGGALAGYAPASGVQYAPVVSQTPLSASAAGQPAALSAQGSDVPGFRVNHMLRPDLAISPYAFDGVSRPASDFSGVTAATQPPAGALGHVDSPRATPARDAINARRAERGLPPLGQSPATPAPAPATGGTAASGNGALSPFDVFRNSTNYQFRLNEGLNALESAYAANGAFDSGAERKAAIKYNQNFASNELANYMNLLAGQQAMGLSAAGAVAGVGTTYAGNVAAQNTSAANAAANAALASGSATAGMYGAIGQGVGTLGGALYQYGMGQMMPQASYAPAAAGGQIIMNPNPSPGGVNFMGGF